VTTLESQHFTPGAELAPSSEQEDSDSTRARPPQDQWLHRRKSLSKQRDRAVRQPCDVPMAGIQVSVQLDDELLSLLDERVAAAGILRSEMILRGVRAVIASDVESKLDDAIAEGYKRLPPALPDASVERLAFTSLHKFSRRTRPRPRSGRAIGPAWGCEM
jgi:hypothetical protein